MKNENITTNTIVSLKNLLLIVVGLKKQALVDNNKELYIHLDNLESELKSLREKSVIFERW